MFLTFNGNFDFCILIFEFFAKFSLFEISTIYLLTRDINLLILKCKHKAYRILIETRPQGRFSDFLPPYKTIHIEPVLKIFSKKYFFYNAIHFCIQYFTTNVTACTHYNTIFTIFFFKILNCSH